ncbi:MAG: transcriptional repressor LexA [Thermoleophilia bacterium]
MRDLTERQKQILSAIRQAVRRQGYPPTVREIAAEVGLASPASVHSQLAALEAKGYLRRGSAKRRALELVRRPDGPEAKEAGRQRLPLVGRVAAGGPVLAEEAIEDYLSVPDYLTGADEDCFLLRVKGDSMVGAGILDGDVVVVRRQETAANGDVVVALVEGEEATLKRFFRETDHIRLQPDNPNLQPFRVRDVKIVGRVIGVMRRL